jgi:hypothetical protein
MKWIYRQIEFFPLLLFQCAARFALWKSFGMNDLVNELWELGSKEEKADLDNCLYPDDEKIINYYDYFKKQERNFR